MRKKSNLNKPDTNTNGTYWKRRPSEIRGYTRTLYITTEDDEYIRVDYNIKEKKVRLYIEDNEEGGNPYYSVINNGRITVERNATTGRVSNLHDKFSKRADIFSTIPNKDVIKIIDKNYGIGLQEPGRNLSPEERKNKSHRRKIEREQVRKKYFGIQQDNRTYSDNYVSRKRPKTRKRKVKFIDVVDVSLGILMCIGLYSFNHNFVTLGVLAAFIGIFIGLLDVYYRERQLIIIKMCFFLLAGVIFYIYGYYIL
ncbi:MAG: DUF308 domain-containing protein [Spirochaetes bacterium]|nr:DUF308 domain-containing protein [Spirochaetota bacterium]